MNGPVPRRASPQGWRSVAATLLVALLGGMIALGGCTSRGPAEAPGISLAGALGDQAGDERFARITGPPQLRFPADHGPHPDYRQEWWYFTGHLQGADGRRFGYQVTFFRFAVDREPPAPDSSRWHATQLYMAHLAVSDIEREQFHAEERIARGAVGLAGARGEPLEVWVEDWRMHALPGGGFRVALSLAGEDAGLQLELQSERAPVLQGEDGYSRKGEAVDNASAYYSITRMQTAGTLRLGEEKHSVTGSSWFDREWGTSFLAPGVAGWDWFSLQLDDGRDLMFYRLRSDNGASTPFSAGTVVVPAGGGGTRTIRLGADDVRLEPRAWWTSAATGVRYPVDWSLRIPSLDLSLEVSAAMQAQELDLAARYWEGAVEVAGQQSGEPLGGRGYLELAGY